MRHRALAVGGQKHGSRVFGPVFVVVCVVLLTSFAVIRSDLSRHQQVTRATVDTTGRALADAAEQLLAAHGAIAQSLGAVVDEAGEVEQATFERAATRLSVVREGVLALELAPGGIIRDVHPLAGNEAAVGLDLNRHPSGRLAMQALKRGSTIVVEGPIRLVQGGQGIVIRSRVDVPDAVTGLPRMWGVAINVVSVQQFIAMSGLSDDPALRWSLRRGAGAVAIQDVILGGDLLGTQPVRHAIDVPGGGWTLELAPVVGWPTSSPNTWSILGLGLFLALVLGLSTARLLTEPIRLRARVHEASIELDRSHGQVRAIMDTAADAILAVDRDGSAVAWNLAAVRLLRVDDEAFGSTCMHEHLDLHAIALTEAGHGHDVGRGSLEVTRRDGTTFPAEVSMASISGSDLRTVIIRDVSEARSREADLQRHVVELERLREERDVIDAIKRDFMAMASHEVRTPITAIRGFALTLNRHWDELEDDERRRSLDVIQRQATRLWQVVSDILTTSQLEGGSLESRVTPVHLRTTIESAIEEAQLPAALVQLECCPSLTAHLDAEQFHRILVALLSNAQKYGMSPYQVQASVDGPDFVVRVIDHGRGVPAAFLPRLFEPFSQASTGVTREAMGTGLGLSVARGLARASGGDIWHQQQGDDGTVFAVRLPREAISRATATPASASRN